MKKLLFILTLFPSIGVCQSPSPIPIDTFRIDPSNAMGGTASQLFSEVKYIPLETTKESIFNKIDQLIVTKKYFIIVDKIGNSILLFNKDGSFHCRISKIPDFNSNVNFRSVQPVIVDYYKREIVIGGGVSPNFYYYDFNGNFLGSGQKFNRDLGEVMCINKSTAVFANDAPEDSGSISPNQRFNLLFVKNNKKVLFGAIPYTTDSYIPYSDRIGAGYNFYRSGETGAVFYKTYLDYRLYKIDAKGVSSIYQFIFPYRMSLPHDFLSDEYDGKRFTFVDQHPSVIFALKDVYQVDNYLLFSTKRSENKPTINNDLIYNMNTGSLIAYSRIQPDSSCYLLPIYNYKGFQASDGKSFYTSIPSYELFTNYSLHKKMQVKYATALENYFKIQNRKSNPVIIQLILKSNL